MATNLPDNITLSRTRAEHLDDHKALHRLHTLYKPASDYDTLQAALDSGYCLIDKAYTITAALTIPDGGQIVGRPGGSIRNTTAGAHVLVLADGADKVRIEGVRLRGTGSTSQAIAASGAHLLHIEDVDCWMHPGAALALTDCIGSVIVNLRAQSEAAVSGIVDMGGKGNHYIGCRIRQNAVGLELVNAYNALVESCVIESNSGPGISARVTNSQRPRQTVTVRNCWFENNDPYAIDADANTYVIMEGCNLQGASNQVYDSLKLDGGALLRSCSGGGVQATTRAKAFIRLNNSAGIYAPVVNLKSEVLDETLFNEATDPLFTNAHHLIAAGTSAPVLAHDSQAAWKTNSARVTFPSGGNGYNFSRAAVGNAHLQSLTAGDMVRVALVLKASRAGELVNVRILSASADVANIVWVSATDWQLLVMEGTVDGTQARPVLHLGAAIDESLNVWIGGVAIVANGECSL